MDRQPAHGASDIQHAFQYHKRSDSYRRIRARVRFALSGFAEAGEEIQLKCVLTCAKVNVEPNGDVAIPGEVPADINFEDSKPIEQKVIEPTQEEKDNVKKLMETFGL